MTTARKNIILRDVDAVYHCTTRCVRRSFLCGYDRLTNRSYEHRKGWVRNRLILLTKVFCIDVLAYAVMSNHLHVMIKTDYGKLDSLSDEEVAYRWLLLYPKNVDLKSVKYEPSESDIKELVENQSKIKEIKERLKDIGWFMKSINEYIARKANKEDDCSGRFWEGRYKCQRVADEGAILKCAMYIDLNPIRARVAETPEKSKYTSVYDRINLAIKKTDQTSIRCKNSQREWLGQLFSARQKPGLLSISFTDYLEILEWTGKQIRSDKRGAIPEKFQPILQRLNLKEDNWIDSIQNFCKSFHKIVAPEKTLRDEAEKSGRRWYAGLGAARLNFV